MTETKNHNFCVSLLANLWNAYIQPESCNCELSKQPCKDSISTSEGNTSFYSNLRQFPDYLPKDALSRNAGGVDIYHLHILKHKKTTTASSWILSFPKLTSGVATLWHTVLKLTVFSYSRLQTTGDVVMENNPVFK